MRQAVELSVVGVSDGVVGGWGALLRFGERVRELSGGEGASSAQRMVLTAAIAGLGVLTKPCAVTAYTGNRHARGGHDDLRARLAEVTAGHEIRWHQTESHADFERVTALAHAAMGQVQCVHEMASAWCALCKPPPAGVFRQGYRTRGGRAYHNDPDCVWLDKGQRYAARLGQDVHEKVAVAWNAVTPGELEPCEHCCALR